MSFLFGPAWWSKRSQDYDGELSTTSYKCVVGVRSASNNRCPSPEISFYVTSITNSVKRRNCCCFNPVVDRFIVYGEVPRDVVNMWSDLTDICICMGYKMGPP